MRFNKMILMVSIILLLVNNGTFSSSAYANEVKQLAKDFTLKALSGENLRLEEMRGDVILINFWASWCGPCRQEMPYLDELQTDFGDLGFTVLGINVEENSRHAKDFINEVKVNFPVLFDNKQLVSELYNVDSMPMTVMVDRHGYQRLIHRGYEEGDEVAYRQVIKELIRE